MKGKVKKVGIIGLGRVGVHLARAFALENVFDLIVYNRSEIPSEIRLPDVIYTHNLKDLTDADLLLITVKDDAIISILDRMEGLFPPEVVVIHCSGSIPATIIQPYFKNFGVLYPLQTFSKEKTVDYSEIPLFVTASDPETSEIIEMAGRNISQKIIRISDEQRVFLHIAAIFTCNYTNAMYAIGSRLCEEHALDFDLLKPLIQETADKIMTMDPKDAQTGPAVRRDWEIIHKHEEFLSVYDENLREIYRNMADYISKNL